MGVVNVTPDSFSDGGVNLRAEDADRRSAAAWSTEGAAIVDVGGESTRPGSEGVSLDEELRRVVPVLEAAGRRAAGLDRHVQGRGGAPGARRRRRARQRRDRAPRRSRARRSRRRRGLLPLPDAHARRAADDAGRPALRRRRRPRSPPSSRSGSRSRSSAGIREERICLDPGIGFGKTVEHNFELVRRLDVLLALGRPVVVGFSRKRSLGRIARRPGGHHRAALGEPRRRRGRVRARRDHPPRP